MEELLSGVPGVQVNDEGQQRVSHGRELEERHLLGRIASAPAAAARQPAALAGWVRLLDGDGRLLALATPGEPVGSLHPSVVLI
jgi:hypothetical protein